MEVSFIVAMAKLTLLFILTKNILFIRMHNICAIEVSSCDLHTYR